MSELTDRVAFLRGLAEGLQLDDSKPESKLILKMLDVMCLENPRDGGAWWAAVYGVTQSQTRLKRLSISIGFQETLVQFLGREDPLEEVMATHSSILAWRIPVDRGAWQATVHGVAKSWT